jgi:hypothetical protein
MHLPRESGGSCVVKPPLLPPVATGFFFTTNAHLYERNFELRFGGLLFFYRQKKHGSKTDELGITFRTS